MQYKSIPKSSDKLSVLGFGCMRLPTKDKTGIIKPVDDKAAQRLIFHALDMGINYFETAWFYNRGDSERFLGEVILPEYRDKLFLSTKLPCLYISRPEQMESIFDRQLEKLGVDHIDYYLLHSLDGIMWEKMKSFGVVEFMDGIQRQGRIRNIGFSFHGLHYDFIKIVNEYDWQFVQVQYNIIDEDYQAGIEGIRYAAQKGLGVFIMEPLRGGLLAGKLPRSVADIYDSSPIKRTAADWGLSWVYNQPEVTVVLSGMNEAKQIDENCAIAERAKPNAFSKEETRTIEKARQAFVSSLAYGCTGCGYCMPCLEGINIPAVLKSLNDADIRGRLSAMKHHLRFAGFQTPDGKPRWASLCTQCGRCEEKCPQHLEIRAGMKQAEKKLENIVIKFGAWLMRKLFGAKEK